MQKSNSQTQLIIEEKFKKLRQKKNRNQILIEERRLFQLAYPEIEFEQKDIFINENEYVHYLQFGNDDKKPQLVLIHGYGGGCFTYFKMVQYLQVYFNVIVLDLPGMGFNSRNEFIKKFKEFEHFMDYYLRVLNSFFGQINLKKFYLAGHSIGAYISTYYFDRHKDQIIKLFLLSPAGVNHPDDHFKERTKKWIEEQPLLKKWAMKYFKSKIIEQKQSPFSYIIFPGYFTEKYLSNKRFNFEKDEIKTLSKIMTYLLKKKQYSECCLGHFLQGMKSERPLVDVLQNHKNNFKNIIILYGEKDWMDSEDTQKHLRKNQWNIQLEIISKADHQITFQNPLELAEKMIDFYLKKDDKIKDSIQITFSSFDQKTTYMQIIK